MYTVYCHVFPNGKKYVGITRTSVERRWRNGCQYKTCPLVNAAIQKYGWENVCHEILATAQTKEEAERLEKGYIAEFDTMNPSHGYNILPGGDVSVNDATPEMREKLGNGWRGKHRTEAEKTKISAGVKKKFTRPESNGHYGLKASNETREKMSMSQTKSWATNESRKKAASERMKKRLSDPEYKRQVLERLAENQRGSGWKMAEETKKKLSERMKGRWIGAKSPTSKPVLQFTKSGEFIKRWENAGEAERAGIALRGSISKCCNGAPHCNTAGGYIWRHDGTVE